MPNRERAERMVDFDKESLETTFDLGPEPTEEEVKEAQRMLDELESE